MGSDRFRSSVSLHRDQAARGNQDLADMRFHSRRRFPPDKQSGWGQASLAQTAKIFAERPAPTLTAIARYANMTRTVSRILSPLAHSRCEAGAVEPPTANILAL